MDLQEIQNKRNTLLAGTERKIVFWYDDYATQAAILYGTDLHGAAVHPSKAVRANHKKDLRHTESDRGMDQERQKEICRPSAHL